jgi:hypothetical protein
MEGKTDRIDMNATLLYRMACVLLILFAAGHTVGFLRFQPPSPEARAVYEAMNNVHFQVRNASFSYGAFYIGFGLFVTAYFLFSAFLAWRLGALAATHPHVIGSLSWGLFSVQVASLILSWIYFSMPPLVFSALVTACLGWAAWLVTRAGAKVRS